MPVWDRPRFLITVDTEGDDLWSRPAEITTRNAEFLPRFQALCDAHRLKPTYLVNYEMANARAFQEFARDALRRGAEVGMHLHAWNNPPLVPLGANDLETQPYLIEYPAAAIRDKVACLSDVLEDAFGAPIVSHRAGRWALDATYAATLAARGYRVDCSVTPHVSWAHHAGGSPGRGGVDYSRFPDGAYFMDLRDIARPGRSPLLEVPMTIVPARTAPLAPLRTAMRRLALGRRVANRFLPDVRWLRPSRRNGPSMVRIVEGAAARAAPYVEFMVHSSELMPGGSPLFRTPQEIDALYRDLETLFAAAERLCVGATLAEYHDGIVHGLAPALGSAAPLGAAGAAGYPTRRT